MPELSKSQLASIMPHAKDDDIEQFLPALNDELSRFDLSTPIRQAHFVAQVAHESGSLKFRSENLNYSAPALRAVFGKYFTSQEMAEKYARQPENIANVVYANRMGNGDTASGDGWRYRGRGLIQLTGKDNYRACGEKIGVDLVSDPEQVSTDPKISVAAACWYWENRKINDNADKDDVVAVTKKINGGTHGLDDRTAFLNRCKTVLGLE